jgi:stearoyl-CoA desaturase (delta-9 desaturase)
MTFLDKYRLLYIVTIFSVPISIGVAVYYNLWFWFLLSFLYAKLLNLVGMQIALHRLFAHNSFKTSNFKYNSMALLSVLTGSGSPITWASHHMYHHKHSDSELDLHSPKKGFLYTALLWPIDNLYYQNNFKFVPKHLIKNKILIYIHNNYFLIWAALIVCFALVDIKFLLFFILAPAGWTLLHSNVLNNYLAHTKLPGSYRTFDLNDHSHNNKLLQLFMLGDGLHNNHHKYMNNYNQAILPNEFDPAAWVIDKFIKIS